MPDRRYYLPGVLPSAVSSLPSPPSSWANHFVDVKDYGARGDYRVSTGVGTDDTAAIQAAIDSTFFGRINDGKAVLLSAGRYYTTAPLNLKQNTMLVGPLIIRTTGVAVQASAYGSSIEFNGGTSENAVQAIGTAAQSVSRCLVEGITVIDRRISPAGGSGVYYEKVVNQSIIRHMDIRGFPTGSSVQVTGQGSNTSDCVTIDDIWGLGSKYVVNLHNIDNTCFVRDIKMDTASTDPLVAGIRVNGLDGVVIVQGVKHENNKPAAITVQLDTFFFGTMIDGIISRIGSGGPVVSIANSTPSGVTIRNIVRQFSGTLLEIVGGNSISGVRLPAWTGGVDGYSVNGARVAGQWDVWNRLSLEGDVRVALTGGKVGFYGTNPILRPVLTYSRATETAATTQIRTTLVTLGLITDSTVP